MVCSFSFFFFSLFHTHCFLLLWHCHEDMFVNTKMDEGPCPKLHTEQLKMAFEQNGDLYMYDHIIEKEFTARLNEADRIIKVIFFKFYFIITESWLSLKSLITLFP